MNQRKPNRIAWYSLGLVLLLCAGVLVMSTGTTFARYRTELEKTITYEIRPPEQICQGSLASDGSFSTNAPVWTTIDGKTQLNLAVANGTSSQEYDYSQQDQLIRLRLLGTIGVGSGESAAKIHLIQTDGTKIQATATPITENTALYHTHGAGWIYTFLDKEGEELSWRLRGGELSFVSLTVTIEDTELTTDSLLVPQVIGSVIDG